ncbi:ankyrin repeat domain-containing protein [Bdellovibrio bacteriovorus]|uniref:ankyrin repeat domain-containing protein n=1 Tax=Bdellovibrio TaxID=958 RepID=UPI0035A9784E
MRKWADYMQTASVEHEAFDFARQGNIQGLLFYLAQGGDPNLKNHKGHSLLMLASYNGHVLLVPQLLRHGADVNSRDNSGSTILMGVAFKGHEEIARLLLAAGADLEAKNNNQQTATMYAEAFGRENLVRLFAEFSPTGNARSPKAFRRLKALFQLIKSPFKGELQHEH